MNVDYSPDVDILYIKFSDNEIEESDENESGAILDYDKDGNVIGMEILHASKMSNHQLVSYRKELGWTQEKLAKWYGKSRRQVIKWEKGETIIPHDTALLTRLITGIKSSANQIL